jgi:glycosyltransferase involved in cell wall biosynthesis
VIYVLIPAFNEAAHLARLLPRVARRLEGRPVRTIVACDGSTDGTCRAAADNGAEVIELWPNSGKGSAVRAGAARLAGRDFDAVVTMDGDGQHDPGDLTGLLRPVLAKECDIAIGSRYLADSSRGPTPVNRYLVRTLFTRLLRHRLQQPVTDPFAGYRCMSPRAFRQVRLTGNRYEGELEVRFEAELHGLEVLEVPIERIYTGDQSKMGERGGTLRGRLSVLRSYVITTRRKTRELAASRRQMPVA